jgi:hypothetical protein
MTERERLKDHLEADCQLAADLMEYVDRLARERNRIDRRREAALAAVKALDLPATYRLRRRPFA